MQLKRRFKEEDKKRAWWDHPYCAICNSNENCSLHHILGCKSDNHDSILNSIMLCARHHVEADTKNVSDKEYQSKLFSRSIPIILNSGYVLVERDGLFYQQNKEIIELCNNK